MDPYDSKVTSNDEKATGPDSAVTQDAVFGSAGNTDVMFTTAKPSQLDCVVVTRVDNRPVTRLVPAADEAESNPQVHVGGGQHDADGSECEQQEPTRKRSQNSSDTSQWEKRNSSMEGTPKRVRTASKGNGANPNRRPRSKSEVCSYRCYLCVFLPVLPVCSYRCYLYVLTGVTCVFLPVLPVCYAVNE